MVDLFQSLYKFLPHWLQNSFVTTHNLVAYQKRMSGMYAAKFAFLRKQKNYSIEILQQIQFERLKDLIEWSGKNSNFYNHLNNQEISSIDDLSKLSIVSKEEIRKQIKSLYTIPKNRGIISKTGGTTGKSLEVIFTKEDMQERFAMLDHFRSQFGYELGKKTAWFSGKHLLTARDIRKNRFWKTDYWYKVRYYSTFHIKEDYLRYYIEDLISYQPEFMVGFPSSIVEIARYGLKHGLEFPAGVIKAVFPTAETVTSDVRKDIQTFFKTDVYDQYASSEGAPFIFECKEHKLHMELLSGVFEVLDENDQPAQKGRLIVTSFTTKGTPLIRYDIGDWIELSDETCTCGNNNPLVKQILGRIDDYVYSPENGKINLGNVSNTLKDTKGIVKFQAIQDALDSILVKIVVDKSVYNDKIEQKFIQNWRDRIGGKMNLEVEYVDEIPVEKSGKYRIVKNNIKHLL